MFLHGLSSSRCCDVSLRRKALTYVVAPRWYENIEASRYFSADPPQISTNQLYITVASYLVYTGHPVPPKVLHSVGNILKSEALDTRQHTYYLYYSHIRRLTAKAGYYSWSQCIWRSCTKPARGYARKRYPLPGSPPSPYNPKLDRTERNIYKMCQTKHARRKHYEQGKKRRGVTDSFEGTRKQ